MSWPTYSPPDPIIAWQFTTAGWLQCTSPRLALVRARAPAWRGDFRRLDSQLFVSFDVHLPAEATGKECIFQPDSSCAVHPKYSQKRRKEAWIGPLTAHNPKNTADPLQPKGETKRTARPLISRLLAYHTVAEKTRGIRTT